MSNESVTTETSDPLKAVADALDAAVKVAQEGAEEARATAVDALPAAGRFLSKMVYQTCYSISYGVVFPSVLLARSIPKDNAAVNGLIDGAHAAMDMVEGMRSKPAG
jgi:hypothetical protein